MSNRKMTLSKVGKDILDITMEELEMDRPKVISIALAKGLNSKENISVDASSTPKWIIPGGIIKSQEYLLYTHLIVEKSRKALNDDEMDKQLIFFIEKGLRLLKTSFNQKGSLEHSFLAIID